MSRGVLGTSEQLLVSSRCVSAIFLFVVSRKRNLHSRDDIGIVDSVRKKTLLVRGGVVG